MRKKSVRITLLIAITTTLFLVLGASRGSLMSKQLPCKEATDQCCKQKPARGSDNTIQETLSGQSFHSAGMF